MCVFISRIFKDYINTCLPIKQWECAYIDLLHRCHEWYLANELIKTSEMLSIRSRNQESTLFLANCSKCHTPIQSNIGDNASIFCKQCFSRFRTCGLCHKLIKGIYTWCHVCGHGGHIHCVNEWFKHETQCFCGCGHSCHDDSNFI